MIPTVLEQSKYGERAFDLYSRMLEDRIVFVNGQIEEHMAQIVIASLLFLDMKSPGSPIQMFIQSPGGSVDAGHAIYDTMCYIQSPTIQIGMGCVASMAQFLLTAKTGREGQRRVALPNARIMMHQPSTQVGNGQATDIAITAKQIVSMKEKFIKLFSEWTTQSEEKIRKDIERDCWLTSQEALKYGMIDAVVKSKDDYIKDPSMNLS